MIDMELFELMKVTLKEVLRAELAVVLRDRQPHMTIEFPSDKLIVDRAFEYAQSAKQRLEQHRPSSPVHDQRAPTIQPPSIICNRCKRPLYGPGECAHCTGLV